MGKLHLAFAIACASLAPSLEARAEPDLGSPCIVWSEDHARSWIVYDDRRNRALVYRMPGYYEIQRSATGEPEVVPERAPDGGLILKVVWGTANWTSDTAELFSRLRALKGELVRVAAPAPVSLAFEAAPELTEELKAIIVQETDELAPLPGLSFTTTFLVPRETEQRFRRALVSKGFTSRLLMSFELSDPVRGVVLLRYETSLFLGALKLCEVTPELVPCGRVQ